MGEQLRCGWSWVSLMLAANLVMACAPRSEDGRGDRASDGGLDGAAPTPADAGADAQVPDAAVIDVPRSYDFLRLSFTGYRPVPVPEGNPVTADKALLGKALFWDVQLSSDDTVACGTCHMPEAGGADGRPSLSGYVGHPGADGLLGSDDDPRGSPGIRHCQQLADGGIESVHDPLYGAAPRVTRRRSMSFIDAMFPDALFWDGRAESRFRDPLEEDGGVLLQGAALESQALMPILNSVEMSCEGATWEKVTGKLARSMPLDLAADVPPELQAFIGGRAYPALFMQVFGDAEITPPRIAMAIATYERTLTSTETPWDRFQAGDDDALSDVQREGLTLFVGRAGCSACHQPPLFGAHFFFNDGFVEEPWDHGRQEVDMESSSRGAFRVVSLRNVGLREGGGLLHDGLWPGTGLSAVVGQYNLPPVYGSGPFRRALHLSDSDIAALVEFLRGGLVDPRVANATSPFDHPRLID